MNSVSMKTKCAGRQDSLTARTAAVMTSTVGHSRLIQGLQPRLLCQQPVCPIPRAQLDRMESGWKNQEGRGLSELCVFKNQSIPQINKEH